MNEKPLETIIIWYEGKEKALKMNALLIKYDRCLWFVILPYFPMQFQTAVEYQHFADRWFKCCVRVALDPVSALNSWWNSGSSFGLA